jgi:hypothetical protein
VSFFKKKDVLENDPAGYPVNNPVWKEVVDMDRAKRQRDARDYDAFMKKMAREFRKGLAQ